MSDKGQQFPFQQFIQALQPQNDIVKGLSKIINGINAKNINWAYSAISAIAELLKNKQQYPETKCKCLQAVQIIMSTCHYIPIIFIEVYLLPILYQTAVYKSKKTQQMIAYYFQKTFSLNDSQRMKKLSLQYIYRSLQLINCANQMKPFRLVEIQQLKQLSSFGKHIKMLKEKGVQQIQEWKYVKKKNFKDSRRVFLQKLKKFPDESDDWAQFLVVNLIQQVKSNKKQLLQLRLFLPFGQSFMTSAIINFCEDQLLQMVQNLDLKRKYLGLLNQLVRNGDIQAIIMIKNSEFLPFIISHFGTLPGHTGLQVGQNIFPQIKGNKQVKKQFYVDFLRCLQTWALSMPQSYDSQQFKIKQIYDYLKNQKKFKFPQNFHLTRYQKQINDNLQKNKQRNNKIIEILDSMTINQTHMQRPKSKFSNILQKTTLLGAAQLQTKIQQAKTNLKKIMKDEKGIQQNFNLLNLFKDEWIVYLQSLDLQNDEQKLENLIISGQKVIQDIQSITPVFNFYQKKKITYKTLVQRMKQIIDFHNDLSVSIANTKSNKPMLSRLNAVKSRLQMSKLDKSKLNNSNLSKSNIGKRLLQKLKSKSIINGNSKLNLTKLMDRSNLIDKSKIHGQYKQSNQISNLKNFKTGDQYNQETIQTKKNIGKNQINKMMNNLQMTQLEKFKNKNQEVRYNFEQKDKKYINEEKQKQVQSKNDNKQKFKIIQDYQTIQKKQTNQLRQRLNESVSSRKSKIMRRVKNQRDGSAQQSQERSQSSRNSLNNLRKKQGSLIKRPSRLSHNIVLQSNNEERLLSKIQPQKGYQRSDYGIAINKDKNSSTKNVVQLDQSKDPFSGQYGNSSISSIHSKSMHRAFNNTAEKLLQISGHHDVPDNKKTKAGTNEIKNKNINIQKQILGDYYTQTMMPASKQTIEIQKKSKSLSNSRKLTVSKVLEIVNSPKKQSYISKNETKQKYNEQMIQNKNKNIKNTMKKVEPTSFSKQNYHQQYQASAQIKSIKIAQKQKDEAISVLQKKIMQLQKQASQMRSKLALKDSQLQSIKSSSKNKSQRGYNFTTASQSGYDNSEKQSQRNSSVQKSRKESTKFQIQVQSGFKQYLQKIKGSTFRKSLLKQKCLVHKNDELEIGCVSQKSQKNLICTLFVTPHRYNLIDFTLGIIHDSNSHVKASHDIISLIPKKKQQKIQLCIQIIKIPFSLIEIQINYKSDSQYSSNYNRLSLPLSFNKFCDIKASQGNESLQNSIKYVRSDNFKINTKVIKVDKLIDSFSNFSIVSSKKQKNSYMVSANCNYNESIFNIMINVRDTQLWIQGFLKYGDVRHMNFLICTFKEILDGGRK